MYVMNTVLINFWTDDHLVGNMGSNTVNTATI